MRWLGGAGCVCSGVLVALARGCRGGVRRTYDVAIVCCVRRYSSLNTPVQLAASKGCPAGFSKNTKACNPTTCTARPLRFWGDLNREGEYDGDNCWGCDCTTLPPTGDPGGCRGSGVVFALDRGSRSRWIGSVGVASVKIAYTPFYVCTRNCGSIILRIRTRFRVWSRW